MCSWLVKSHGGTGRWHFCALVLLSGLKASPGNRAPTFWCPCPALFLLPPPQLAGLQVSSSELLTPSRMLCPPQGHRFAELGFSSLSSEAFLLPSSCSRPSAPGLDKLWPLAKSSPLLVFTNKALIGTQPHTLACSFCGCCAAVAGVAAQRPCGPQPKMLTLGPLQRIC